MAKQTKIFLLSIVVAGLLLRLFSLNYALPIRFYGDEYVHLANALKMLEAKTAFLDFSYLPNLFAYLLIPLITLYGFLGAIFGYFEGLAGFREYVILNSENLLILSRLISVFFGGLTVYFIFKITKEFFNERAGLLAALILAILPLHLIQSQSGQFWNPLTFFILAAFYFLFKLFQTGERRWYFWSALFIALGFGTGIYSLIVLPWFFLAHFLFVRKNQRPFWSKDFIFSSLLFLAVVAFFAFSNSYATIRQLGRGLGTVLDAVGLSLPLSEIAAAHQNNNFFAVLKNIAVVLWFNFYHLLPLIFWGWWELVRKKEWWRNFSNYILFLFPLAYILVSAMVFNKTPDRYVLPVMPFLVIVLAYALDRIFYHFPLKPFFKTVLLVVVLAPQIYFTLSYSEKLLKTNTNLLAKNWLEKNVPAAGRLVLDNSERLYLTASQESLKLQLEHRPAALDTRDRYLLTLTGENYPQPSYFIYRLGDLKLNEIKTEDFRADYYLITFYNTVPANLSVDAERDRLLASYEKKLVQKFYPTKKEFLDAPITPVWDDLENSFQTLWFSERLGPRIELYQLIKK